jgi:hypothetical protein
MRRNRKADASPSRLRILGLGARATRIQVESAISRLRGHVIQRLGAATDEGTRRARSDELANLEAFISGIPADLPGARPDESPKESALRSPGIVLGAIAIAIAAFTLGLVAMWISETSHALRADPAAVGTLETEANADENVVSEAPQVATLRVESVPPGGEFILERLANEAPIEPQLDSPDSASDDVATAGPAAEHVLLRMPADGQPHQLPAGPAKLRVLRADCPGAWSREIELVAGAEARFAPRICEGQGQVVVRSNVSRDRLTIDSLDLGSTGQTAHTLEVGDHAVRVEKSGYEPWTARVRLRDDEALTLRAELKKKPGAKPEPPNPPEPPEPPAPPETLASARPRPKPPTRPEARTVLPKRPETSSGPDPLRLTANDEREPTGGSRTWHDQVSKRLLKYYDSDHSGALDTRAEAEAVPCDTWRAIESSYDRGGLSVPMSRLYGFDGSTWTRGALGFDRNVRLHAYERMTECGLRS